MMFGLLPFLQAFAAADSGCLKPEFFGLVPWYKYLTLQKDASGVCTVTSFNAVPDGTGHMTQVQILGSHSPFLLVALAILDDLIRVAGLVAVGFVIYGGIQYTTSQGAPDATKRAQSTIINALVGVAIAIIAASGVAFLGSSLAKSTAGATGPTGGPVTTTTLPKTVANSDTLVTIINLLLGVVASITVLMVVIGGFRYIAAHGDPNAVAQARKSILYALIGLVVTMVAFAMVAFVVRGLQ